MAIVKKIQLFYFTNQSGNRVNTNRDSNYILVKTASGAWDLPIDDPFTAGGLINPSNLATGKIHSFWQIMQRDYDDVAEEYVNPGPAEDDPTYIAVPNPTLRQIANAMNPNMLSRNTRSIGGVSYSWIHTPIKGGFTDNTDDTIADQLNALLKAMWQVGDPWYEGRILSQMEFDEIEFDGTE